ncbi:MAG: fused MFS/spermidine synthase [Planctomycetes bacterium]|nr:fused MFS/spermidine synthase [Planctomycetota bacterium]MCB9903923.1 fused MFS/spermidine synthase [Planctomycetota bacterium]
MRTRLLLSFSFVLFLLSGFAALLYQVVWQRILTLFSGADLFSVTVIVAAFMAGMGFGSLAGGSLADRLQRRGAMAGFALAELSIGLFALVSEWLYFDFLPQALGSWAQSTPKMTIALFLSLLWPTFFMGMSLPLLAKGLTRSVARASSIIGGLYALNTLGAALGSVAAAWLLIRNLGLDGTLYLGASLNTFCALGAAAMYAWGGSLRDEAQPDALPEELADLVPTRMGFRAWMGIYALSGFVALGLEMVWFRLLGVLLKSNAFVFATLLGHFLIGLALGMLLGIPFARRTRNPSRAFLLCQTAIAPAAGVALLFIMWTVGEGEGELFGGIQQYFAGSRAIEPDRMMHAISLVLSGETLPERLAGQLHDFFAVYLLVPAVMLLPSTILMGFSFPLLQRVVQTDARFLGRRVGWLQTSNIVGSTLGSLVGSWVLLRLFGTAATLRVFVSFSVVFWLLSYYDRTGQHLARTVWSKARGVVGAVCLIALVALLPSSAKLWSFAQGHDADRMIFAEDGTGLTVLEINDDPERPGEQYVEFFAGGQGQGLNPFGGGHVVLGMLPVMMHPDPQDVAIIGLGSGGTLFGAASRDATQRITCIEIVASQMPAIEECIERLQYDGLIQVIRDPRVEWVYADGRSFLAHSGRLFDVIEADALKPSMAYSGNLYSVEYFELLRDHLKPGGFAVSWAPTQRTIDSFVKVFPHAVLAGNVLIGSRDPIPYNLDRLEAQMKSPETTAYLARGGFDSAKLVQQIRKHFVAKSFDESYDRDALVELNTDLYPRDEYGVPQADAER